MVRSGRLVGEGTEQRYVDMGGKSWVVVSYVILTVVVMCEMGGEEVRRRNRT